ncbi:hypothetical protein nbrc107696_08250 [Gordonia spumicola]|uniref:DUF4177 domain-containing protein n=1 Tax=Gordonia spumicola TaxID=589161 RepID=A0A7I9V4M9_9ACTN|nr:hypothetical protein [Gordonia spumicola]GEE00379.1 hypothetical protein nbrc107696_08250 [Gordonia spumicola]
MTPFYRALAEYGQQGWELVSNNPTDFVHSGRDTDKRGIQMLDYPYNTTMATEMLAIFKRRAD